MRPPAGPHTVAEPQLHSSRGHTESTSNARAPLLDHIKLQSRSRSSTAAPRGHPQRPLPTLAPPRWATYSYKTAAPQQHRVVIRSVPFQRSPPPRWATYSYRTASPQQHRVVICSVPPLDHIQLQNSSATPRSPHARSLPVSKLNENPSIGDAFAKNSQLKANSLPRGHVPLPCLLKGGVF